MDKGGFNFTTFSGVNLRNTAAIRFSAADGGFESTLSLGQNAESGYAFRLPLRSGTLPVAGTFAVQIPALASGYSETAVTITGLRREDAFFTYIRDMSETTVTASTRTYPLLAGARPENGYVYLTFCNPSGTTTAYSSMVMGYITAR